MGFFSDLKEDLSQAVSELMPMEENPEEESLKPQPGETVEAPVVESADREDPLSLEAMLENIDDIRIPEEPEESMEAEASDPGEPKASLEELLAEALAAIPERDGGEGQGTGSPRGQDAETEPAVEESIAAAVVPDIMAPVKPDTAGQRESQETVMAAEETERTGENTERTEEKTEKTGEKTEKTEENTGQETPAESDERKGAEYKMDSYAGRQVLDETAVITKGMQIIGDVISEGSLEVIGAVEGNIEIWGKLSVTGHVTGNSKVAEFYAEGAKICGEIVSEGAVKIGEDSVIIGNITAKSAAIAGAIKGDIDVQGPVILDSSAIVMGNIRSKSVQINNGAAIEGMCSQCYADVSPTSFFDEYKTEQKSSRKKQASEK